MTASRRAANAQASLTLAHVWGRAVRAVGPTREQTPVFQGSARRMVPLLSQKRSDNFIQMSTSISPDFHLNPAQFVVIIVSVVDHPLNSHTPIDPSDSSCIQEP